MLDLYSYENDPLKQAAATGLAMPPPPGMPSAPATGSNFADTLGGYDAVFGASEPAKTGAAGTGTDWASAMGGAAPGGSTTPPPATGGANWADAMGGAGGATQTPSPPGVPAGDEWAKTSVWGATPSPQQQPNGAPGAELADLANKAAAAPGPSAPSGDRSGANDYTAKHTELLGQITSATDPQQKEVLKDQLARSVFVSLKTAGHDVKWNGDQLMVDGRAYVVGGDAAVPGAGAGPVGGPQATSRPKTDTSLMEGDPKKLGNVEHMKKSPKYQFLSNVQGYSRGQEGELLNKLKTDYAQYWNGWEFDGRGNFLYKGDPAALHPSWGGVTRVDAFGGYNAGGPLKARWGVEDPNAAPAGARPPVDPTGAINLGGPGSPQPRGAGGVDVGGRVPGPMSNDPAGGWTPTSTAYDPGAADTSDLEGFTIDDLLKRLGPGTTPGALDTGYKPGQVSNGPLNLGSVRNDPLNLGSVQKDVSLGRAKNDPLSLGRVESYRDGSVANAPLALGRTSEDYADGRVTNGPLDTYSFDGQFRGDVGNKLGVLGAGKTDPQTEELVSSILANPESLSPQVRDMMKAASKDELAQMARTEDENLTAAGYATGNADSNWLQSEKLASKGRRDQAIVASNRDIELTAAEKNMADKRGAAGLGNEFANSRSQRLLAERGQRFTEAATGEGLEQAEVSSKNKASQFDRDGQVINEDLRGKAFDRRQGANVINAGRTKEEAAFAREGDVINEDLRNTAFQNRKGSTLANAGLTKEEAAFAREGDTINADRQLREASFRREGDTLNADRRVREAAFGREGENLNADRRIKEAAFGREGELANEGLRSEAADRNLKASQQNIDNQFRSTAERQTALKLASDTALSAAAQRGDRKQFAETLKIKAKELGLSADKLRQDMTLALLSDATSRYGISVGADVDMAKLRQAGGEFQTDMIFKLKALAQADRQFGAGLGLDYAKAKHQMNQDNYKNYKETFGD